MAVLRPWIAIALLLAEGCGDGSPASTEPATDARTGMPSDVSDLPPLASDTSTDATPGADSAAAAWRPFQLDATAVYHDGSCFVGGLPPPDAAVADMPQPAAELCPLPPTLLWDAAPPQPTLQPEVGVVDPNSGAFVRYEPGAWVPLLHGPQGWFHIEASFRVDLPGTTAPTAKLLGEARAWLDCAEATTPTTVTVKAVQAPEPGDVYTNANPASNKLLAVFPVPSANSGQFCGRWITLRVALRLAGTNQWGAVTRVLRTYDSLVDFQSKP
jgi:hypothetical protein